MDNAIPHRRFLDFMDYNIKVMILFVLVLFSAYAQYHAETIIKNKQRLIVVEGRIGAIGSFKDESRKSAQQSSNMENDPSLNLKTRTLSRTFCPFALMPGNSEEFKTFIPFIGQSRDSIN